jgi:predicted nucleotidyltransferase
MLDQSQVDAWLAEFLAKLKEAFGQRLRWVGHHGSWASGEARLESDIDCMVVLDRIDEDDLTAVREAVSSVPRGLESTRHTLELASGVLRSVSELRLTPRFALVQYFYGCKVLHGTLDGIVNKPEPRDLLEDIKLKVSEDLIAARHYLIFYPHEDSQSVHKLKYFFKCAFYALQSLVLLTQGKFINRKDAIGKYLENEDDKEVVRVIRDWHKLEADRIARPLYYIKLLDRWGRSMIKRLEDYA